MHFFLNGSKIAKCKFPSHERHIILDHGTKDYHLYGVSHIVGLWRLRLALFRSRVRFFGHSQGYECAHRFNKKNKGLSWTVTNCRSLLVKKRIKKIFGHTLYFLFLFFTLLWLADDVGCNASVSDNWTQPYFSAMVLL